MVQNPDPPPPQGGNAPKAADASPERKDEKAAAPVRKRLSLACTTCRQRKVKCDGQRPSCRTCAKFNWPCIYQPSNRKRGPRPRALALMDGSMPYSGRTHWHGAHYYAYGMAGQPPMSPPLAMPPPPPVHQMMPMNNRQFAEMHSNGAPVRMNPAQERVSSYNQDAFSTYSDYISSTGGIRIHPQGPHQHHPPMHSPPFNAPHMGGGPARHRAGSHYQHHIMDAPAMAPYAAPMPQAPGPFAYSRRGTGEFGGNSGVGSHRPAPHMQLSPAAPGRMRLADAAAAGPELAKAPQSAINAPGSTVPQHMQPSAQSYTSASAYAPHMQPASTDAAAHTPAIYARKEPDVASSRSSSSSAGAMPGARRPSRLSPCAADAMALSSPVQPHAAAAAADQAMTAPIPSAAAFSAHARAAADRPHEFRPYTVGRPDYAEPVSAPPPLPFSDGASRPRLPPLSEVLGKDYQQILAPNGDGPGRPAAAVAASHYGMPPRHKDAFSSEASRIAFESTR
ncbi:hypothetical protein LPJ63_002508 [Coemansia sp. RSA 2711]|nr:hypothetical protein LPJ63_002508 [Coemansia sp. RSA 2711]